MSRDYKSRAQAHTRRNEKKSLPGYVWLIAGLAIGLFVALIVYLDKQPEPDQDFGAAVQQELEKLKADKHTASTATEKKTRTEEKPKKKEQKFNFYTLLPELEVLIPESETRPPQQDRGKDTSTTTGENKHYVLQVGSFQNLADAEKQKANLAFLGLQASIQHVTVNRQSWHRVRTGPYSSRKELYKNQSLLKKQGIDAISLELK